MASEPAAEEDAASRMRIAPAVIAWFGEHARDLPWRRPGFSAWGTLVSEFMLQQTPVARVIEPLAAWLERWPTPAALAAEPAGEAVRAWGRLGYPRRALNLHASAVAITEQHGGNVPRGVEDLLALPGVGSYTARAVAAFAFGQRQPVVDTNVRRVLARSIDGRDDAAPVSAPRDLAAMERVLPAPETDAVLFSAGIMELGAVVCTARAPRCGACPLADRCAWKAAGYPPADGTRRSVQKRFEGSDRQVRGIILAALRLTEAPLSEREISALWPDELQRNRALEGLIADGLTIRLQDGTLTLPYQ